MHMSLSKLQEIVKDREDCHAVVHGVAKSRPWRSDWTASASQTLKETGYIPAFRRDNELVA